MEQIIISMPSWANTSKEKTHIKKIRNAISLSHVITIEYRNYMNEISTRQIEPMSIVFKGYTWHLFAYCRLKKDFRVFRISRIISLENEDILFERKNKSYLDMEEESKQQDLSTSITLKFDSQVRSKVEDIFTRNNIQFLKTGEMIVTAQFPDKQWYHSLILSFGESVEILGPEHIRQAIALRVKSMYEKYI